MATEWLYAMLGYNDAAFVLFCLSAPALCIVAMLAILRRGSTPTERYIARCNGTAPAGLPPAYDDLAVYQQAEDELKGVLGTPGELMLELRRISKPGQPSQMTMAEWYADYKMRNSMTLDEYRRMKEIEERLPKSVSEWSGE